MTKYNKNGIINYVRWLRKSLTKNGSCKRVLSLNCLIKIMGVLIKERRIKKYEIKAHMQKYDIVNNNGNIIYNSDKWLYKNNIQYVSIYIIWNNNKYINDSMYI